ncbi:MAG: hypothetical protein ACKORL_05790 [Phycisphaerales bacterium]
MPIGDWQFWIASLGALAALWLLVKPLLGARGGDAGAPARRTTLTIGRTDGVSGEG